MLTELRISNYALIDDLEVNFSKGLTSVTGETGAGKSILLGGLALVLGKRADLSTLKDKNKKCYVDATFSISAYKLESFFEVLGLDYEPITIIRREIIPSGKSRAFVNDTPITLDIMQQLGDRLIDVHSQHQTLSLTQSNYQLEVLDALAKNNSLLENYQNRLGAYRLHLKRHEDLKEQQNALVQEKEYNTFLLTELENAPLTDGILESLKEEIEQLSHVEEIEFNLGKSVQIIEEEQQGVQVQLNEVRNSLQKVARLSSRYEELSQRMESLVIELIDLNSELGRYSDEIEANPVRLEEIQFQYQLILDLIQKHQVQTVDELIVKRKQLSEKVIQTAQLDETLTRQKAELDKERKVLNELSDELNENRQSAITTFVSEITKLLSLLGMPKARFQLNLIAIDTFLPHGKVNLDFTFSANEGSDFGPLAKVASGGELSRIMLSIKAILSQFKTLPTIIFDEIDTGVSGEIAHKTAEIMAQMSDYMQVITITHLPQVAAKGIHHFKVFKENKEGSTFTRLRKLSFEDRIIEIAKMLSGEVPTDSALNHAKELLN